MDIGDFLSRDGVIANLRATSKKQALQELSKRAAALTGLDERELFDVLIDRERMGATAKDGVAVPHGYHAELDRTYGVFAHLADRIDFDAADNQPVDLVFLLLAPKTNGGAGHLKALARVSRLFRDKAMCAKLRGAQDQDALFALLVEPAVNDTAA